ncbi:MAG: hypothetical protein FWD90_03925 [Defluviitaleaceae bacterium]|nr:hypothetical protein [Defluviitaleaceae bacterium]
MFSSSKHQKGYGFVKKLSMLVAVTALFTGIALGVLPARYVIDAGYTEPELLLFTSDFAYRNNDPVNSYDALGMNQDHTVSSRFDNYAFLDARFVIRSGLPGQQTLGHPLLAFCMNYNLLPPHDNHVHRADIPWGPNHYATSLAVALASSGYGATLDLAEFNRMFGINATEEMRLVIMTGFVWSFEDAMRLAADPTYTAAVQFDPDNRGTWHLVTDIERWEPRNIGFVKDRLLGNPGDLDGGYLSGDIGTLPLDFYTKVAERLLEMTQEYVHTTTAPSGLSGLQALYNPATGALSVSRTGHLNNRTENLLLTVTGGTNVSVYINGTSSAHRVDNITNSISFAPGAELYIFGAGDVNIRIDEPSNYLTLANGSIRGHVLRNLHNTSTTEFQPIITGYAQFGAPFLSFTLESNVRKAVTTPEFYKAVVGVLPTGNVLNQTFVFNIDKVDVNGNVFLSGSSDHFNATRTVGGALPADIPMNWTGAGTDENPYLSNAVTFELDLPAGVHYFRIRETIPASPAADAGWINDTADRFMRVEVFRDSKPTEFWFKHNSITTGEWIPLVPPANDDDDDDDADDIDDDDDDEEDNRIFAAADSHFRRITNGYRPLTISVPVTFNKVVEGTWPTNHNLAATTFGFRYIKLNDNNTSIGTTWTTATTSATVDARTGQSDAAGGFTLTGLAVGTHRYLIEENIPAAINNAATTGLGWGFDRYRILRVEVSNDNTRPIRANASGVMQYALKYEISWIELAMTSTTRVATLNLNASGFYTDNTLPGNSTFANTYVNIPSVNVEYTKKVVGDGAAPGATFNFQYRQFNHLTGAQIGSIVPISPITVTTDPEHGTIFGQQSFSLPVGITAGVFYYLVEELVPNPIPEGWIYDRYRVLRVTVAQNLNDDGGIIDYLKATAEWIDFDLAPLITSGLVAEGFATSTEADKAGNFVNTNNSISYGVTVNKTVLGVEPADLPAAGRTFDFDLRRIKQEGTSWTAYHGNDVWSDIHTESFSITVTENADGSLSGFTSLHFGIAQSEPYYYLVRERLPTGTLPVGWTYDRYRVLKITPTPEDGAVDPAVHEWISLDLADFPLAQEDPRFNALYPDGKTPDNDTFVNFHDSITVVLNYSKQVLGSSAAHTWNFMGHRLVKNEDGTFTGAGGWFDLASINTSSNDEVIHAVPDARHELTFHEPGEYYFLLWETNPLPEAQPWYYDRFRVARITVIQHGGGFPYGVGKLMTHPLTDPDDPEQPGNPVAFVSVNLAEIGGLSEAPVGLELPLDNILELYRAEGDRPAGWTPPTGTFVNRSLVGGPGSGPVLYKHVFGTQSHEINYSTRYYFQMQQIARPEPGAAFAPVTNTLRDIGNMMPSDEVPRRWIGVPLSGVPTADGTYHFLVEEKLPATGPDDGWTYDRFRVMQVVVSAGTQTVSWISVPVSDISSMLLPADIAYYNRFRGGYIPANNEFENAYRRVSTQIEFFKEIAPNNNLAGSFAFNVYALDATESGGTWNFTRQSTPIENTNATQTIQKIAGQRTPSALINFTFFEPGEHFFLIEETLPLPPADGWTYDRFRIVRITVTEDGEIVQNKNAPNTYGLQELNASVAYAAPNVDAAGNVILTGITFAAGGLVFAPDNNVFVNRFDSVTSTFTYYKEIVGPGAASHTVRSYRFNVHPINGNAGAFTVGPTEVPNSGSSLSPNAVGEGGRESHSFNVTFYQPGTYYFLIEEEVPSTGIPPGWEYDRFRIAKVDVTFDAVTDSLVASAPLYAIPSLNHGNTTVNFEAYHAWYAAGSLSSFSANNNVFINRYSRITVTVPISKEVRGITSGFGTYNFAVREIPGSSITTTDGVITAAAPGEPLSIPLAINLTSATGSTSFNMEFQGVGTHYYLIEELGTQPAGWRYDRYRVLRIAIENDPVTHMLRSTVTWLPANLSSLFPNTPTTVEGNSTFVNIYYGAGINLTYGKEVRSRNTLAAAQFETTYTFRYIELEYNETTERYTGLGNWAAANSLKPTAANNPITSNINITYNAPGIYYYLIEETSTAPSNDWVYDKYRLLKVVIDYGDNGMLTKISQSYITAPLANIHIDGIGFLNTTTTLYTDIPAEDNFINVFLPKTTDLINITKTVVGSAPPAINFAFFRYALTKNDDNTFTVTGAETKITDMARNGSHNFSLTFSEPGEYYFLLEERMPAGSTAGGWILDAHRVLKVTVTPGSGLAHGYNNLVIDTPQWQSVDLSKVYYNGQPLADVTTMTPDNGAFNNTYFLGSATISFYKIYPVLTSPTTGLPEPPPSRSFAFTLRELSPVLDSGDLTDNPINMRAMPAESSVLAGGEARIQNARTAATSQVSYNLPNMERGTYYFRLTENPNETSGPHWNGWTHDRAVLFVKLTSDPVTGQFSQYWWDGDEWKSGTDAPLAANTEFRRFTNTFDNIEKGKTSLVIEGIKELDILRGNPVSTTFTFDLVEVIGIPGGQATGTINNTAVTDGITSTATTTGTSDGKVFAFDAITWLLLEEHDQYFFFRITERNPGPSWMIEQNPVWMRVLVTHEPTTHAVITHIYRTVNGVFTTTEINGVYNPEMLKFLNTYAPEALEVTKVWEGAPAPHEQIVVELVIDGVPSGITEVMGPYNWNVVFNDLEPGRSYSVIEKTNLTDWTMVEYSALTPVSGDGFITGTITVTNRYTGLGSIDVYKEWVGADIPASGNIRVDLVRIKPEDLVVTNRARGDYWDNWEATGQWLPIDVVNNGTVTFTNLEPGYIYTVKEQGPTGWVASYSPNVEIIAGENMHGSITITNTSTLVPAPLLIPIYGIKMVNGEVPGPGWVFDFTVRDANSRVVSTGSNDQWGVIFFDPIEITTAGTHRFTVTENPGGRYPAHYNVTFDNLTHIIEIEVVRNGNGTLSWVSTTYIGEGPDGADETDYDFDREGTAQLDVGPKMKFFNTSDRAPRSYDSIEVKLTGLKKVDGAAPNSHPDYDSSWVFGFSVHRLNDETNELHPVPEVMGYSNGAGNIIFDGPILINEAGTHTFIIREVLPPVGQRIEGMTYDEDDKWVIIQIDEVEREVNGELVLTLERTSTNYDSGYGIEWPMIFVNEYTPPTPPLFDPVQLVLYANKDVVYEYGVDAPGTLPMFTFNVTDMETSNPVTTGQTNLTGGFTFAPITFTEPGTYRLRIEENRINHPEFTYDTVKYFMTVEVTEENGSLSYRVDELSRADDVLASRIILNYGTDEIRFVNTYAPSDLIDTSIVIYGNKVLTGRDMVAGEFIFHLLDAQGRQLATTTNDAYGNFSFTLYYSEDRVGTHNYRVIEIMTGDANVSYDVTVYELSVNVYVEGDDAPIVLPVIPPVTPDDDDDDDVNAEDDEDDDADNDGDEDLDADDGDDEDDDDNDENGDDNDDLDSDDDDNGDDNDGQSNDGDGNGDGGDPQDNGGGFSPFDGSIDSDDDDGLIIILDDGVPQSDFDGLPNMHAVRRLVASFGSYPGIVFTNRYTPPVTPTPTPESTPRPLPTPRPRPTPTPIIPITDDDPLPTPSPSPSPTPTPTPTPTPSPSPTPEPETDDPEPEPSPSPTPETEPDDPTPPEPSPSPTPPIHIVFSEELTPDSYPPDFDFTGTQPDPDTPGGSNPYVPPVPSVPGYTLVPMMDGDEIYFMEFDDMGIPLGNWCWDDDEELWIFEDWDVPLGDWESLGMPATGETPRSHVLFGAGLLMTLLGITIKVIRKKYRK